MEITHTGFEPQVNPGAYQMVARAAAKAPQAIAAIAVATRFIGLTNSTGVALISPGGKNGDMLTYEIVQRIV
jgi:hypothetical protein